MEPALRVLLRHAAPLRNVTTRRASRLTLRRDVAGSLRGNPAAAGTRFFSSSSLTSHGDHVLTAATSSTTAGRNHIGTIDIGSHEGKALFTEAMGDGTLEAYFPLAAQFRTQDSPVLSGHTALVTALNALQIDPRRIWKGPWRWFSEEMLDCCKSLDAVRKQGGLTLDEFARLAVCNAASAEVFRPDPLVSSRCCGSTANDSKHVKQEGTHGHGEDISVLAYVSMHKHASLEDFRVAIRHLASSSPVTTASGGQQQDEVLLAAYSRQALGCCASEGRDSEGMACKHDGSSLAASPSCCQTCSDVRFAAVAGFHGASDRVLLLDPARKEHAPFWVELATLWRAMHAADPRTGMANGFIVLRRRAAAPLLLYHDSPLGPGCSSKQGPPREKEITTTAGLSGHHHHLCLSEHLKSALAVGLRRALDSLSATPPASSSAGSLVTLERAVHTFIDSFRAPSASDKPSNALPSSAARALVEAELAFNERERSEEKEETRCVGKLSGPHVGLTARLLGELEATPIFEAVSLALGSNNTNGDDTAAAGSSSIARVTVEDASLSSATLSSSSSSSRRCEGATCIRIREAHVYTLLVMAASLASSGSTTLTSTLGPTRVGPTVGASESLGDCLRDAVSSAVALSSPLLSQEVALLRHQLQEALT
jgi:Phytochelatin synthase